MTATEEWLSPTREDLAIETTTPEEPEALLPNVTPQMKTLGISRHAEYLVIP